MLNLNYILFSMCTNISSFFWKISNVAVQIATLVDHTDKSIREIANALNISKSSVGRVVQWYKESGSAKSLKNECNRKRITSFADDRVLIRISKANPKTTTSLMEYLLVEGQCNIVW